MIHLTEEQVNIIQYLNPLLESKFVYNPEKWDHLNKNSKNIIRDFENSYISRNDVLVSYCDYFSKEKFDIYKPLLLTMVWGFGDTGYGTYRTNIYMNDDSIRRFTKALDHLISDNNYETGLHKAFKEMMKVEKLGISYVTKILYFATKATRQNDYALIYDKRVASSLVKLTTTPDIYKIIIIQPSSKFYHYKKYNTLIHETANTYNINADQLELYLFNQNF